MQNKLRLRIGLLILLSSSEYPIRHSLIFIEISFETKKIIWPEITTY
jgi:hypothetical protein